MDKIICVSNKVRNNFVVNFSKYDSKTIIINNLIDFKKMNLLKGEKNENINKDNINIVSVGRKANNNIKLFLVGNGTEYNKIQKYIIKHKLN